MTAEILPLPLEGLNAEALERMHTYRWNQAVEAAALSAAYWRDADRIADALAKLKEAAPSSAPHAQSPADV